MKEACRQLEQLFPAIRWSTATYTRPIHCIQNTPFLNRIGLASTPLSPDELRNRFKQLEKDLGRTPDSKQAGIIPMDIDLLLWNDCTLKPEDMQQDYIQKGIEEIKKASGSINKLPKAKYENKMI